MTDIERDRGEGEKKRSAKGEIDLLDSGVEISLEARVSHLYKLEV